MCGILCIVHYFQCLPIENFDSSLKKLVPRGPDMQVSKIVCVDGGETFPNMGEPYLNFGFSRLAIMETSQSGMQPMTDATGNVVVCNGEIYNFEALKKKHAITTKTHCDCEVILPVFEKTGFKSMIQSELDAEFAMCLFSDPESKLYVARDRYGVRPLYYGYNNKTNMIGFASELKALHEKMEFVEQLHPGIMISIDLTKSYTDQSSSMQEFIKMEEYYSYKPLEIYTRDTPVDKIRKQIHDLLTAAVRKRLIADVPIGFLLSGGLDSSLIVAIATKFLDPSVSSVFLSVRMVVLMLKLQKPL